MADEYRGDTLTAGVVIVGNSAPGNIETGGDTDGFKVSLIAGQSYLFDVEGSPTSGWLLQLLGPVQVGMQPSMRQSEAISVSGGGTAQQRPNLVVNTVSLGSTTIQA